MNKILSRSVQEAEKEHRKCEFPTNPKKAYWDSSFLDTEYTIKVSRQR